MCFPSRYGAAPPHLRRCPHCTGACPCGVSVRAAEMQVGRALRSEHARARPAYPRDPLGLRSTRHTQLSHSAASPCVHRSILLLLVERRSSSTQHSCFHRSRAPALWSQHTILGGSDTFSRRCARWCAEHFPMLSHFGARALFVCLWVVLCCCDSMVACGTADAHSRQPCGASSWSWAVRMRSCGDARDGVCHVLWLGRTLERGRPRCAFVACDHTWRQKCVGRIRAEFWSSVDP